MSAAQHTAGPWVAAELEVATPDGLLPVAGWVRGVFALDFRVFDILHTLDPESELAAGWALTHLPTGYAVAGLVTPLNEAKELVERISALGDWDFTDLQKARGFSKSMAAMRDQAQGAILLNPTAVFSPIFPEDVKATGAPANG